MCFGGKYHPPPSKCKSDVVTRQTREVQLERSLLGLGSKAAEGACPSAGWPPTPRLQTGAEPSYLSSSKRNSKEREKHWLAIFWSPCSPGRIWCFGHTSPQWWWEVEYSLVLWELLTLLRAMQAGATFHVQMCISKKNSKPKNRTKTNTENKKRSRKTKLIFFHDGTASFINRKAADISTKAWHPQSRKISKVKLI